MYIACYSEFFLSFLWNGSISEKATLHLFTLRIYYSNNKVLLRAFVGLLPILWFMLIHMSFDAEVAKFMMTPLYLILVAYCSMLLRNPERHSYMLIETDSTFIIRLLQVNGNTPIR